MTKPNPKQLAEENQELTNHLQRLQAEFDNYRKRTDAQLAAAKSTDKLLEELLPIQDNLALAFDHSLDKKEINPDELLKGILMIQEQLTSLLADHGITEIQTEGQFKPELHEALMQAEGKEGHIVQVFQKGYMKDGKILRPAKVSVGGKT